MIRHQRAQGDRAADGPESRVAGLEKLGGVTVGQGVDGGEKRACRQQPRR